MAVSRMSKERAPARKGMLSSYAASRVRRTTPVTVRCQPPSRFTRAARPPPRLQGAPAVPARGGGGRPRAAGAAARASRSPAPQPLPLLRTPRPPLRLPSGVRALRPPCPQPAPSDCADLSSLCGASSPRLRSARTRTPQPRRARCRTGTRRTLHSARSFACLRVVRRRYQRRPRRGVGIDLRFHVFVRGCPRAFHAQLLEQKRERFLEI